MRSYCHRGGEPPLLGRTIPEQLDLIASRYPEMPAVAALPQGRRLNYRQLAAAVDRLALGLLGLGFAKGERIGIWATNNLEWLLLQLATARIGAILVNINPAYRPRELSYALQRARVQGLFTIPAFRHSDYLAMLRESVPALERVPAGQPLHAPELPDLRRVLVYDPADPAQTPRPGPGFGTWADLLAAANGVAPGRLDQVELDPDEAINIQFTSGTTGFPKAVLLTHHNLLNNAWFAAQAMHFGPDDRLCIPVPFYHCFGMVLANLLCLSVGACAVIPCEHFDPLAVLQAIDAERCTALHGVPTMFIAELDHPRFAEFDLGSLRTGIMAGAPCDPALMRRVMERMHCRDILIGYGQTEASPLTHLTDRDDSLERRTQTVGRNLPHQEVKVIDPQSGNCLPLGEIGEVCFRGYQVMAGYYSDPTATAKAIDPQGWLHSGDLGSMDADGYLRITGRLKEMIIRGGENLYPREIEEVLMAHPQVAMAAVFGVPDAFYGEEVMAWVQLHADGSTTEDQLRAHCRQHLAHFKVPRYVWFVDEFPMTVTGKLQKFRMRELAMERLGCAKAG